MNLKCETIVQIFRKIIQLNAVIILNSANEYYQKVISKSGRKMDLYPAMMHWPCFRVISCATPTSFYTANSVVNVTVSHSYW